MKVVFDTNILVSAFVFPGGAADLAIRRILSKQDRLFTSRILLNEFARILSQKFDRSEKKIEQLIAFVAAHSDIVQPKLRLAVLGDEPDNRVLECALVAKADAIVTGDKAMLTLREYRGIRVISLKSYLIE